MKLATVKTPKPKGKQRGYQIVIYQVMDKSKIKQSDEGNISIDSIADVKIFQAFISASAKEGKEELSKALIHMSELGIS